MVNEAKEMEKTMGNIVQLLQDANKPAEGLASAFGDFTANSKSMEVIMRLASGTGLWRFLNKIKAVGISINQWNENAAAAREETSKMYDTLARQQEVLSNLNTLQNDLNDKNKQGEVFQSNIYKGLKLMYGEEYAILKLREDTTDALKLQQQKMIDIKKLGASKDLLKAIGGGRFLGDETKLVAEEAERRGFGEIQKYKGGQTKFKEYKGAKKFFSIRWAGLKNLGTKVGNFVMGLSKMIKAYFLGALSLIGSILMWGAVVILAIILLKPVFMAMWESIKKHGPALLEKLKMYWEEIKIIMQPILDQIIKIWDLFIDPKSSFADLIGAVFVLLGKILVGTISLLLKVGIPLALDIVFNVAQLLIDTAGTLLDSLLTWIGEETLELMDKFPEYYDKFKLWLDDHPFLATLLGPITIVVDTVRAAWEWFQGTEFYKNRQKAQEKTNLRATAEQDRKIWEQKGLTNIVAEGMLGNRIQRHPITGEVHSWGWRFTGKDGKSYAMPQRWNKDGSLTKEFANLKSIGALARGGFVGRSGQYLVGERGPELVNLPGGSNVTANHAIGNTINVHVNGRVGASDQELRDIARRVGSMINREINRTTTAGVRL